MNNYLHSLPFNAGQGNSSDCDCPGQAFDPAKFKIYSESDRLPTFILRLPPLGENPDLTYAAECIRVFSCDLEEMVANITMNEADVQISKDGASYFVTYDGDRINGLNLECAKCYRIKILSFWSEPFWITDTPQNKITFSFYNNSQLGDVPYQKPLNFVQRLMVDGEICSVDAEIFQNKKTDSNGNEQITFQRLTQRKELYLYNVPEYVQQLIGSLQLHEKYTVETKNEILAPLEKRTTIETSKNGCCDYDLKLTMPLRDINVIGGKCQSDADGSLTVIDIPDDLPDSCEIDDDYTETEETLCLKFGDTPPIINPPITPVGTPPVGNPCPPQGLVLSNNTQTTDCSNAWISEGVKYKKKILKIIADGNCSVDTITEYAEPCDQDTVHEVSNLQCSGPILPPPPVGTPPVGSPPVGTPPVGSPPVGTPPVGTPPPTSSGSIQLSGYYGRDPGDSNNDFKCRIDFAKAPYYGTVKNFADQTVYPFSNLQADELAVPNSVMNGINGGVRITVTDSLGATATIAYDNGTLKSLKVKLFGLSIADGDANNHINRTNEGENRGYNMARFIWESNYTQTDAQLIAFENAGKFNHNAALPSQPVYRYDPVVKNSMSKNTCKFFMVNLQLKRPLDCLNNGSDRTLFFGIEDGMKRPDGSLVSKIPNNPNGGVDGVVPSAFAPNTLAFAKRWYLANIKRFQDQFESGEGVAMGMVVTSSGEFENTFTYQIGETPGDSYNGETRTHGDFHPASVALFKQRFPEYANLSNNDIAFSSISSQLNIRWKWHNNQGWIDLKNNVLNYVAQQLPGFKRLKYFQDDAGSWVDELAFNRCTLNSFERVKHPASYIIKSNDGSNVAADRMKFVINHGTSLARSCGGKYCGEPSPEAPYENPNNLPGIVYEVNLLEEMGGDVSIYTPQADFADQIKNQSGFGIGEVPENKQEFQIINGVKKTKTLTVQMSQVFPGGGFGGNAYWETQLLNFMSANNLTHVNTRSIDDVKPS